MPTVSFDELMREAVAVQWLDNITGVKNTVFDITIPEGYAMVIHDVDFILSMGSNPVANGWSFNLCDDPDETADPGHTAEKTIQSTTFITNLTTNGASLGWHSKTLDCHKTMLVVNPNFVASQSVDANATVDAFCRIWFDFVKISPKKILELLRQQQY